MCAHDVHSHFAFMVFSFHCIALSITTAISRCPCVASSSDRTCSAPPKSASARSSASSSGNPAALCSATASSKCSRSSCRTCWRSALGPPMPRQTWSRYCSSFSIGFLQDAVHGEAQLGPGSHLLAQRLAPLLRNVVIAPLAPGLLFLPLAGDQPVGLHLVQARIQRSLTPGERPVRVAMHRRR